jgi:glutamine amidotransferase
MCELFALSSQLPTRVTFSLEEFSSHGGGTGPNTDGWGLAFYDGSDAQLFRETEPAASSEWMLFLLNHPYYSNCVLSHIRKASSGEVALRNTQPFSRVLSGKRHVFCHNGNLVGIEGLAEKGLFSPVGETDSEYAFCWLMNRLEKIWRGEPPSLNLRIEVISEIFLKLSEFGSANILFSDAEYLYAFANKRNVEQSKGGELPGMYYLTRHCEFDPDSLRKSGFRIQSNTQDLVLFASVPLSSEDWHPLVPNQFLVARHGRIISPQTVLKR